METEVKTQSETPGLDRLRRLNANLSGLLADPHPGLFTWSKALSETLTQMSDYAGHGRMSAFPDLLEACKAMLVKLDAVHKSTEGIFVLAHVHGHEYAGPNWQEEYQKTKAAIAKAEGNPV